MTDRSLVNNGRVARIGEVPAPALEAGPVTATEYNRTEFSQSATAVTNGRVRQIGGDDPALAYQPQVTVPLNAPPAAQGPQEAPSDVPPALLDIRVPIIGILGHNEAGKSTLAAALADYLGGEVLPLAEALRESLVASGLPRELVYEKPTPPMVRDLLMMQAKVRTQLGGDSFYADEWQKSAAQKCLLMGVNAPLIIDDLRRPAELAMLRERGGLLIDLINPAVEPDPLEADAPHTVRKVRECRGIIQALMIRRDDWIDTHLLGLNLENVPPPNRTQTGWSAAYFNALPLQRVFDFVYRNGGEIELGSVDSGTEQPSTLEDDE